MRQHSFLVAVMCDEAYVGLMMGGLGLSILAVLGAVVGVYRLWIRYHPPRRAPPPAAGVPQQETKVRSTGFSYVYCV